MDGSFHLFLSITVRSLFGRYHRDGKPKEKKEGRMMRYFFNEEKYNNKAPKCLLEDFEACACIWDGMEVSFEDGIRDGYLPHPFAKADAYLSPIYKSWCDTAEGQTKRF